MHIFKYLLTTLLIFYASLAYASAEEALRLNRADAVDLALRQNHSLLAARTAIEEAGAYARYAGRLENPELRLGYSTDRAFNNEGEQTYSIGFEQRFPITNRLRLLKDVSAIEVRLAEAELLNEERLLIEDVESAFALVSSLNQRLELLDGMIRLQQDSMDFLERRVAGGEASTLDINQAQVSLFSVQQDIQNLTKERDRALASLRSLLGIEPAVALEILSSPSAAIRLPEMPALHGEVLHSHPEYALKSLLAEIARGETALANANQWADVGIEIFFEEERGFDAPEGLGQDRFFGIGLSIPLPLHDRNRGEIEASRARERQIRFEMSAVALRLQNEAEALRQNAQSTFQQAYEYKEQALSLVEQNLDDINDAYAAGLVDLGEVFRVQEQHLSIQTAQLELWHEFQQILIEWRAATARNLPSFSEGDLSDESP